MRPRLAPTIERQKSSKYSVRPIISSDSIQTKEEQDIKDRDLEDVKKPILAQAKNLQEEMITDTPLPIDEHAVNKDDLLALGSADLNMDGGDDELLAQRTTPVDFSGKDLDVPGSELDDKAEAVGSEDEENNNYSLGGEDHQDLEESKP